MTRSMTVAQMKAEFSQVLVGVQNGDDYEILFGRNKRPIAKLTAAKKEKRVIGTLAGIAEFSETDDGKISVEEFLGI